jgi:hypothetical protein
MNESGAPPLVIAGELLKLGAEWFIQEEGKLAAEQNVPKLLDQYFEGVTDQREAAPRPCDAWDSRSSTFVVNRACMVVTDVEPGRLAPLASAIGPPRGLGGAARCCADSTPNERNRQPAPCPSRRTDGVDPLGAARQASPSDNRRFWSVRWFVDPKLGGARKTVAHRFI